MWTKKFMFVIAVLSLAHESVLGANHYVRAQANGHSSGADWTNAYTNLPSSLVRGDTYYIADGAYSSHQFNDAPSGTSLITIKKATSADHGTDTGWSPSYDITQATFENGWQIITSYYYFDGMRRNSDWNLGTLSQYGIRVANTRLDDGNNHGSNNLTFHNIDFHGGGRDTGDGDDVIYGLTGNSNLTFSACALHDSDRTIFLMRGNWQNLIVDHSYLARNTSTPATHGEMLSMTDSTNVTWSNNAMEDIEGTAFIAGLNGGVAAGWKIFGNTFLHTAAYLADTGRKAGHNFGVSGTIFIANDASQNNIGNNFQFINNTLINIQGTWSGLVIQSGSGNEARNNIWYNSVRTNNSTSNSNNWYFNTVADGDTGSSAVVCTSNCNIFVNLSNRNFHLSSATAVGFLLSAPFNMDGDSKMRGSDGNWDRGAFEFTTDGGTAPNPSPSPTPSPNPSPSPTPAPSPTATPKPTPTPLPSPTPISPAKIDPPQRLRIKAILH